MDKLLNILTLGIRWVIKAYKYYKLLTETLPLIEKAIEQSEHLKGNYALVHALKLIKLGMKTDKQFEKSKDWIIKTITDLVATSKKVNIKK